MPLPFRPNCLPTALGPLPHPATVAPWSVVLPLLRHVAPVPLLAHEGESLAALAVEGLAGLSWVDEQLAWDRALVYAELDGLYAAYLQGHAGSRALRLHALDALGERDVTLRGVRALSTTQLGPISLALALTGGDLASAAGEPAVVDGLAKHICLRLQWQLEQLERWNKPVIQWLYEPYLEQIGSPFVPLDWPAAQQTLADAFGQRNGVRGVWAGGKTDLGALLADEIVEVVGCPLPETEQLDAWAAALRQFIRRKGVIGWGLIPASSEGLRHAMPGRLAARFGRVLRQLSEAGLPTDYVVEASLIMPEESLAQLLPGEAEAALRLTAEVAGLVRQSYGLE